VGFRDGAELRGPDLGHLPQATELGAQVRKGEKASLVVYANSITRTEHDDATGQDTEREIPYMKGYSVFNVEQIDGLPEIYYAKATPTLDPVQRIERAEVFVAATQATVKHGGNRAYYAQELDYVQMPPFEAFREAESYYGTILHELVHSTKHRSRLDRDLGRKSWGDAGCAAEELVAELGSAFLCADLEIALEPRDIQRCQPCATRRRLSQQAAGAASGGRRLRRPLLPMMKSSAGVMWNVKRRIRILFLNNVFKVERDYSENRGNKTDHTDD
jgi:antirestriction protein ArdC